jgi:DNA-binding FadR family transcriptional regulator
MPEYKIFDKYKGKKRSESLVKQIKDKIFRGEFLPGEKLPSERELSRRFEVSRVTLREGLKKLVSTGFLEVKRGVKGGYFVIDRINDSIRESIYDLARMNKLPLDDVVETRIILESEVVRLACERATKKNFLIIEKELKEHKKIIESNESEIYKAKRGLVFHRLIAESVNNSVLASAINYIIDLHNIILPNFRYGYKFLKVLYKEHVDIYLAIKERNPEKASILMKNHLNNALVDSEKINRELSKEAI